ncbi:MAG TPA: hypothetical protein VNZ26_03505 [Vicinamibacterales bacterium]|nr:hypothetical protein [Vicinamibacterales bacterium]
MRTVSRFIGAMPMLALCALTSVPVAAADQGQADLAAATAKKILFAEGPATLIVIDGEPVYQPLKGTDLQRITNTKPFIVRDGAGIHYLKVLDGWMQAYSLYGMWSVAGVPPLGAEEALQRPAVAKQVNLLDWAALGKPDSRSKLDDATAPEVFVSTTPAELVVMDGAPRYTTVRGTTLKYLENTTANVFKEPTDDELYVLTSSGWFRSWRTDGPWQFVRRSDLPADIAAIPDDSPVWHR